MQVSAVTKMIPYPTLAARYNPPAALSPTAMLTSTLRHANFGPATRSLKCASPAPGVFHTAPLRTMSVAPLRLTADLI